jgi:hypothetical protein
MRKTLSLVCILGLTLAAFTFDAQAMPTAPVGASAQHGLITKAAEGCGRGWHRARHWPHRCVPN